MKRRCPSDFTTAALCELAEWLMNSYLLELKYNPIHPLIVSYHLSAAQHTSIIPESISLHNELPPKQYGIDERSFIYRVTVYCVQRLFLADRTNCRAIATLLRLSSVVCRDTIR